MTIIETPKAPPTSEQKPAPRFVMLSAFKVRDFRLVWLGETISLLGDQFYLIALPLLALQLTGSGLALGTILAVAGIPRAALMLVGGAITDRFSPRRVMLATNLIRMLLTLILTALVLTDTIQFWMLYINAFLFGLVDAFYYPAQSAIVPNVVDADQIESGNALTMLSTYFSQFIGPVLAGVVIASLSGVTNIETAGASAQTKGIAIAFAFDALTFLIASLTLLFMNDRRRVAANSAAESQGIWASITEGLRVVWKDRLLRIFLLLIIFVNFAFNGPMAVGIPLLANKRFTEQGALALGIMLTAMGGGAVLGTLLGGGLPSPKRWGIAVVGCMSINGIWLGLIGLSPTLLVAVGIISIIGVIEGYINVMAISWLQKSTPPELMGRVMSLITLGAVGLEPFSNAFAGALGDVSISLMFATAGILFVIINLYFLANPTIRSLKTGT